MILKTYLRFQNFFYKDFCISDENNLVLVIENQKNIYGNIMENSVYVFDQIVKWAPSIAVITLVCFLGYELYNYKGSGPDGNNNNQTNLGPENQEPNINLERVRPNHPFQRFEPVNVFDEDEDEAPEVQIDEEITISDLLRDRNSQVRHNYLNLMDEEYMEILEQQGVTRELMSIYDPNCLEIVLDMVLTDYPVYNPFWYYRLIRAILILRVRTIRYYNQNLRDFNQNTEYDDLETTDF